MVLEAPAVGAGLDDIALVCDAIETHRPTFRIAEHARPFADRQVGSDDYRGMLIKRADQVEEQLAIRAVKRQISKLVEHH